MQYAGLFNRNSGVPSCLRNDLISQSCDPEHVHKLGSSASGNVMFTDIDRHVVVGARWSDI